MRFEAACHGLDEARFLRDLLMKKFIHVSLMYLMYAARFILDLCLHVCSCRQLEVVAVDSFKVFQSLVQQIGGTLFRN